MELDLPQDGLDLFGSNAVLGDALDAVKNGSLKGRGMTRYRCPRCRSRKTISRIDSSSPQRGEGAVPEVRGF